MCLQLHVCTGVVVRTCVGRRGGGAPAESRILSILGPTAFGFNRLRYPPHSYSTAFGFKCIRIQPRPGPAAFGLNRPRAQPPLGSTDVADVAAIVLQRIGVARCMCAQTRGIQSQSASAVGAPVTRTSVRHCNSHTNGYARRAAGKVRMRIFVDSPAPLARETHNPCPNDFVGW